MIKLDIKEMNALGYWLDKKNEQVDKARDIETKRFYYAQYNGALKILDRLNAVVYFNAGKHSVTLSSLPDLVDVQGLSFNEILSSVQMFRSCNIPAYFSGLVKFNGGEEQ